MLNEQQDFWANDYALEYIKKNTEFDYEKGKKAWGIMLSKAEKDSINTLLECGSNIGRNINSLNGLLPNAKKSIIELSRPAYNYIIDHYDLDCAFNGTILEFNLKKKFNLVFTIGVLIHIHPDDLISNMKKMYEQSNRYILIGEYFNRTPVMLEYQGKKNQLFKRDFGRLFIERFDAKLVDYGFLWGYIYDNAGFDDITWWLFEKTKQ